MGKRNLIFFVLAIVISTAAAVHRWEDSGHAMGLISAKGGRVRHPSFFECGHERYAQILTATVLPPYRGDVRVDLQGYPAIDYEIHLSRPILDLGVRPIPSQRGSTIAGLQPGDRIALWALMRPPPVDPVCGMRKEDGFLELSYNDKTYYFCAEGCRDEFLKDPPVYADRDSIRGEYRLAFSDTKTGKTVLNLPIIFGTQEESHAGGHHH